MRLSVVRRDRDGSARFVCDAVARVPEQTPNLDLGPSAEARFDLYAEWFDPMGKRAAQGVLPALGPEDMGGEPLPLVLFRTEQWSCPLGPLGTGRAFHSATPLPSGEVLFVGGIAALPERGPSIFQILNSVEVWDPRTNRFYPVAEAPGVVPRTRAFHHAAVLEVGPGVVRLLVQGGLTAPLRRPALDGAPGGPTLLRLTPIGTTQPAGAEILTYEPATRRLWRRVLPEAEMPKVALSGGAALPAGGLVHVGGAVFPPGLEVQGQRSRLMPVDEVLVALAPSTEQGPLRLARRDLPHWLLAPTVTPLGPGAALVLGAARSLPEQPAQVQTRALRLGGLDAAPRIDLRIDLDEAVAGPATLYHAAARLADVGGEPQVLASGGFVLEASSPLQARQPPPPREAVRLYHLRPSATALVAVPPYGPVDACGSEQPHYRPAGFEAIVATLSGTRALITGGTPTAEPAGCQDCEPGDTGTVKLLCVLRQASLYDQASGRLHPAPPLALGRMGHTQTLLPGGAVLVAGGLTRPGGDDTVATTEAEVFVPRPRQLDAQDPDDPLAPLLQREGLTRHGLEAVRPCRTL